ncbi:hypothetical protein DT23_00245 [Thioclava indica]|uniref:L,D-TPase catalytic domain-containing protein n=2 Tax=Thioclava indica TaxID=1353528 RepID=A0A074K0Y7_9RHOB|nr:hypothetical protein DT23_00245 [Thioclava indica]
MARLGANAPPPPAPLGEQADSILVSKAERRMVLLREGRELASYPIVMGANWDRGHKLREGDERTPEGTYVIDWRNSGSVAHLSLHISYPNAEDRARAKAAGADPGGNIMIHGLPNGWGALGSLHLLHDWTNGCIGVSNDQMDEIWSRVPNGTPITIAPLPAP